jgi:signal transduction histidine kinase
MSAEALPAKTWGAAGTIKRSRWPLAGGVALALFVLAGAIFMSLLHLRRHVFAQIATRDGEILEALATQQYLDDKASDESIRTLDDTGEQIQLAFEISQRLHNVIGVRLFSPDGKFVIADPPRITEATLHPNELATLREGSVVGHFLPHARPEEQDLLADTNSPTVPLLEINLPLREDESAHLAGIAQFLLNGESIAGEYADLDRHLAAQGALAFAISGGIIAVGLLLAFRRVQRANALLAERTSNLLKANRELALAAKTSAIGAVTSHLIHGLKNPLSGLRNFVQERALGEEPGQGGDWQLAVASTQRMQSLIDRVVRVLQEQQTVAEYEVSLDELLELITGKLEPVAKNTGVLFRATLEGTARLSNHEADLLMLILENLVQNAIEATPAGKCVRLTVSSETTQVLMEVEDQGVGLEEEQVHRLFTPCPSLKKGGSGIGLTISRQLAIHLGATLDLKQTSKEGTCFRLCLPLENSAPATEPVRDSSTDPVLSKIH